MSAVKIQTIQCPNCKQTLPMSAMRCQFCGSDIGKYVARPDNAFRYRVNDKKSWQEILYFILAAYWVLEGGYMILQGLNVIPGPFSVPMFESAVGIVGGVHLLLGIGLLFEQTWAQLVMKVWCWINLAFGLLNYLYVFASKHPGELFIMNTVTVGFLALQLYVINTVGDA